MKNVQKEEKKVEYAEDVIQQEISDYIDQQRTMLMFQSQPLNVDNLIKAFENSGGVVYDENTIVDYPYWVIAFPSYTIKLQKYYHLSLILPYPYDKKNTVIDNCSEKDVVAFSNKLLMETPNWLNRIAEIKRKYPHKPAPQKPIITSPISQAISSLPDMQEERSKKEKKLEALQVNALKQALTTTLENLIPKPKYIIRELKNSVMLVVTMANGSKMETFFRKTDFVTELSAFNKSISNLQNALKDVEFSFRVTKSEN